MPNYPLPTSLFFKHMKHVFVTTAMKLFLFIIAAEISIMALFSYLKLDDLLSSLMYVLADGGLLALMIAVPFYAWMVEASMKSIKDSQERLDILASAVKYAGDGIMITNRHGNIEYVNQALRDILRCKNKDIIGKPVSIVDGRMESPTWRRSFIHTIFQNKVWHDEQWGERSNGEKYLAKVTVTPIWEHIDTGISHFVTIVRDQTEHHALEMKYHQAQKMEAVGTLVGGIAHDFNNMLSSLNGHIFMSKALLKQMPLATSDANEKILDRFQQIESLNMHAAEMIQQLMTFARKGDVDKTTMTLSPFMKEALKLAVVSLPANINFKHSIKFEGMAISANATQLQQALLNLINNASDALAGVENPEISISLNQVDAGHACLQTQSAAPGIYAEICVADNGCGIDEDHIARVIEPFYTTKEVGKGTGLGLAMVYGFVQEHQGYIDINSRLGSGTSIHLFFPIIDCCIGPAKQTEQVYQGEGETILLVEDQPDVREAWCEVLESLGYLVLEAGDGVEALDTYALHASQIAAVVSDVMMPRMQGSELALKIKQLNSRLPVILMSGYQNEDMLDAITRKLVDVILAKPVPVASLSSSLNQLIMESKTEREMDTSGQMNLFFDQIQYVARI